MKTFRLYKRDPAGREMDPAAEGYRDRPYYVRFQIQGQHFPLSTGTNDAKLARDIATRRYKEFQLKILKGESVRLDTGGASVPASREKLYDAYRTGPARANSKTRELNLRALDDILGPNWSGSSGSSVDQIDGRRIRTWFETVNQTILAESDQERQASLQTSANSKWRKAKSVFRPRCLQSYRDKGLYHANLEDFVRAGNAAKFEHIATPDYHPPGFVLDLTNSPQTQPK